MRFHLLLKKGLQRQLNNLYFEVIIDWQEVTKRCIGDTQSPPVVTSDKIMAQYQTQEIKTDAIHRADSNDVDFILV